MRQFARSAIISGSVLATSGLRSQAAINISSVQPEPPGAAPLRASLTSFRNSTDVGVLMQLSASQLNLRAADDSVAGNIKSGSLRFVG